MASSRTILRNLRNLTQYLDGFHRTQRSTQFEKFVAEALSHILYLPFYTQDNDDPNVPHRVIWHGSVNPPSKAPQLSPDATARCYDFYLTIEATRKTGANQWIQEFGQSIRHCEDFCVQNRIQHRNVFVLMICTTLFRDTYQSIRGNPRQDIKLVPIRASDLAKILETSILAFSFRHLELRKLFHQISDSIRESPSERDFFRSVDSHITKWQKDVLQLEKSVFIGLKSYEAMRTIGRTHIGMSEILQRLERHPTVRQYCSIIGDRIGPDMVGQSLINQSFACRLTPTYDEELFAPVPHVDFNGRYQKIIDALMRIR